MITGDGNIHLITYEDYALVTLPVPGYDPDRMTIQLRFLEIMMQPWHLKR